MDAELWRRAQELFHEAVERTGDARTAFLDEACADPDLRAVVERMLAADASAPPWLDESVDEAAGGVTPAWDRSPPHRLGPYEIVGILGTGGMGTVYEAKREGDFRMRVAIKSIRPGPASAELLERFQRERQILANLQHPSIARILDGGEGPDGRPWFALEYVDGTPIDTWCDEARLGIDDRVRLFVQVCRAVQHAHLNLVLHRDLKPSNVLVTRDGDPKLLDFGIARILDVEEDPGVTRFGARQPLTPGYASPEQLRDEPLTTASDVYQLGLMLHRLLTGRVPEPRGGFTRAGNVAPASEIDIAATRGLTPDRLSRRLAGDLDTIVRKALSPEPEQRYGSADALADDLERHLQGRPVRARPPSATYRAGRFVRRNRLAVGAGGLVLLAIVGGAGVAWSQARRADAERDLANEVSTFLEDLLTAPDPFQDALGPAADVRMVDFIDHADRRVREGLGNRPRTRARMLTLLGKVQRNLGETGRSVETLREAVVANRSVFGAGAQETLEALRNLGLSLTATGAADEAETVLRAALEGQVALTGETSLDVANTQELLARGLLDARRLDEAEPLLRSSLETRRRLLGAADPALVASHNGLAALHSYRGDQEGALAWTEEAVRVLEGAGAEHRANLGLTLGNLGGVYRRLGRLDEADSALSRGTAILHEMLGPSHFLTAGADASLAAVQADLRRYEEADSLWSRAIRALEEAAPDAPALAGEQGAWARALRQQGRLEEAETRARAAVEASRRIVGPRHPLFAFQNALLGDILLDLGRLAEAERAYDHALGILPGGPADANALAIAISRARVWESMGRRDEAEAALLSLHAEAEASLGRGHPSERRAAGALVEFYERAGRPVDAEPFR